MEDEEPGSSLDTHAPDVITINNMRYQAFNVADFIGAPICDVAAGPTGLSAGPIGSISVSLHWSEVVGADKYQVMLFPVADPADKTKKNRVLI